MSLIDEALKRARQEAAQKAAEREGMPYPAIPRHHAPPRASRRLLLVLALALTLGLGAGAGAWLASGGGSGTLSPDAPTRAEPPTAVPVGPPAALPSPPPSETPTARAAAAPAEKPPNADEPAAAIEPRRPATAPSRQPAPAPRAGDPPPARPTPAQAEDPVVLVLPENPASPEPAAPERAPTTAAGIEEYYQMVDTSAGGRIELGGIAWSETGPFALLNGRVLAPGSSIESYEVTRIGPRFVELRGEGRLVRLNLP